MPQDFEMAVLKWLDNGRQDSLWLLRLDQAFEKIRFEGY